MQIILMCQEASATSALHAERIGGEEVPDRWYTVVNHIMTLSGFSDPVLHHDADELLRNPLFRMPTPAEQEAWTGLHKATDVPANVIQESTLETFSAQVERVNGDGADILTEQALSEPESPPAVETTSADAGQQEDVPSAQSKKKASGG